MIIELNTDGPALAALLAPYLPDGVRVAFFFDPTLKIGIHAKGQHIKAKLALAAQGDTLRVDLKDVKVDGLSVGGNPWERFIPTGQLGTLTVRREAGGILLSMPGLRWKAAGVHDNTLTCIVEVGSGGL